MPVRLSGDLEGELTEAAGFALRTGESGSPLLGAWLWRIEAAVLGAWLWRVEAAVRTGGSGSPLLGAWLWRVEAAVRTDSGSPLLGAWLRRDEADVRDVPLRLSAADVRVDVGLFDISLLCLLHFSPR